MAIKSNNFNVDKSGNMTCNNGKFTGGKVKLFGGAQGNANLAIGKQEDYYNSDFTEILPGEIFADNRTGGSCGFYANAGSSSSMNCHGYLYADNNGGGLLIGSASTSNFCTISGANSKMDIYGDIYANAYNYNSLEKLKKNIEKCNKDVKKIIKSADLYEFNYNTEKELHKKHIGFVIGEEYKTPNEIISDNGEGIDTYSITSILWQAVKELIEKVEYLENKLKEEK